MCSHFVMLKHAKQVFFENSAQPFSQVIGNMQVAGPICRGSFKLLSCPLPRTVNIVKVFYGRDSANHCTE